MNKAATIVVLISYISSIGGAILYLRKLWKHITEETKSISDGVQCLLRSRIRDIYYKHVDENPQRIREYERQDLDDLYEGYKALGGNHFIDDLYEKMRNWTVVT